MTNQQENFSWLNCHRHDASTCTSAPPNEWPMRMTGSCNGILSKHSVTWWAVSYDTAIWTNWAQSERTLSISSNSISDSSTLQRLQSVTNVYKCHYIPSPALQGYKKSWANTSCIPTNLKEGRFVVKLCIWPRAATMWHWVQKKPWLGLPHVAPRSCMPLDPATIGSIGNLDVPLDVPGEHSFPRRCTATCGDAVPLSDSLWRP